MSRPPLLTHEDQVMEKNTQLILGSGLPFAPDNQISPLSPLPLPIQEYFPSFSLPSIPTSTTATSSTPSTPTMAGSRRASDFGGPGSPLLDGMDALKAAATKPFYDLQTTLRKELEKEQQFEEQERGLDGAAESAVHPLEKALAASGLTPAATTLAAFEETRDKSLSVRQAPKLPSATVTSRKEVPARKAENAHLAAIKEDANYPYVEYVCQYDAQGVLQPVMKPSKTSRMTQVQMLEYVKENYSPDHPFLREVSSQPTRTDSEILFQIKMAYHHDDRARMGEAILPNFDAKSPLVMEDGYLFTNYRLMTWQFKPRPSKSMVGTPEDSQSAGGVAIYQGPPRVLELGCSDGSWCFKVKRENQTWIVEGIDDKDLWTRTHLGLSPRDFMNEHKVKAAKAVGDYFEVPMNQHGPEFTVRNLNHLIRHEKPFLHNLYDMIRGRDIFDRIENYKAFLDDVYQILQPGGVIELLEIDPHPRSGLRACKLSHDAKFHRSGPATNYMDGTTADRFMTPVDKGLATTVPGWQGRVTKQLEGKIRPKDPIAALNLKSWMENAGFDDIHELVESIPVGGSTRAGKIVQELLLAQIFREEEIQQLKDSLPAVETDELKSGRYHINLHIVTGRKLPNPRAGDLLLDGTRQEMTDVKYEAMTKKSQSAANHWTRLVAETNLEKMMDGLAILQGSPQYTAPPSIDQVPGVY